MKENKGITLISLIITIIILLILAGISISGLFGTNGLITKAKEAAVAQKKAQYFEEINLEILDEQTERFGQAKEEAFIKSLQTQIQNKKWVSGVLICDDNFEEKEKIEENTILIIDTKDGYEIIVEVNNSGLTAQIRENYFEKIGKKCEVKYNNNGGNGKVESQEIRKGFSVILQESTLTKNGYEFVGWSKDKEGTGEIYAGGSKLKIEEDTTLYAIWKKDTVTITFEGNGGTGEMLPITVTKGKETKLPENTFQMEGYSFVKWNTNQDGTGTEYTNGTNITINEDTILYAQWEIKVTATINFNQDKLTEGTKITIGGTALSSGIQKVELKIGTQTVYSEELQNTTTYTKELGIEDLNNIINLSFNDNYTATLGITSINNNKQEISKENIKNYTIGTATNLNKLATAVNSGTTFEGETILQIADINLSSVCSSTKGSWEPIGYVSSTTNYWFNGIYNGNGKQIINLYINTSEDKSFGLFGLLGYKGTVKNVTVGGTILKNGGVYVTAGVVARNEGIVDSCINNASVTSSNGNHVGGVVANNINRIINCINNGNITSTNSLMYVGGVCGFVSTDGKMVSNNNSVNTSNITIEQCTNNGNVISKTRTGGILGNSENEISSIAIKNCINTQNTIIKGESDVGGICGYIKAGEISSCTNEGTVEATSSIAGGIAGYSEGTVTSCKNKGTVTSDGNPSDQETTQGTGGIVGRLEGNGTVNYSSNTDSIIIATGYFAGGIVGFGMGGTSINGCYNKNSNISVNVNGVGGIAGRSDGITLYNCYNYLSSNNYSINATNDNAGGIIGVIVTSKTTIENCYNIGENIIASTSNYGAFVGHILYNTDIKRAYYSSTSSLNAYGTNSSSLNYSDMTSKTQALFKSPVTNTSSVAYLLNGSKTSGEWSQNNSINDGYPYLVNNIPE